jgi:hypothetical protein
MIPWVATSVYGTSSGQNSCRGSAVVPLRISRAALEHPDDTVREALYPVVPGGVKTLSAAARELKATERAVAERVRCQLRGTYSHYYRRMLAPLLAALEFRCNNSAYRPVMDAIDLLARYGGADSDQKLYAAGEKAAVDGVVPKAWLDGVVDDDGRVERIPYELCLLIALRGALRCREVYVQGAGRWKDPDEYLPGDFEDNRDVHHAELGKPLDAAEFTGGLKKRLAEALTRLDTALARGTSGGVRIVTRQGSPWVSVPKLDKRRTSSGSAWQVKELRARRSRCPAATPEIPIRPTRLDPDAHLGGFQ